MLLIHLGDGRERSHKNMQLHAYPVQRALSILSHEQELCAAGKCAGFISLCAGVATAARGLDVLQILSSSSRDPSGMYSSYFIGK